jgi:hypothetical protein
MIGGFTGGFIGGFKRCDDAQVDEGGVMVCFFSIFFL